jgi:hypothetical protein
VTIILRDALENKRAVAGEDYERAVIPEERKRSDWKEDKRKEGNGESSLDGTIS